MFVAFRDGRGDLLTEQPCRDFFYQRNFVWSLDYGNSNEQNKAPQTERQLLLIVIFYLNQNSNHNFYLRPEFKVGPDENLLRKAKLNIQLCAGIARVQKIPFKDVVIKMMHREIPEHHVKDQSESCS